MRKTKKLISKTEMRQTDLGTIEVDCWVTSDGNEFMLEDEALQHEFLWRVSHKHKNPVPHFHATTLEFQNQTEAEKYFEEQNYSPMVTDLSTLVYPNKFVVYEDYARCDCGDTDYCYCANCVFKIVTLEEYKSFVISYLESL